MEEIWQNVQMIFSYIFGHLAYINLIFAFIIVFFQRKDPKSVWAWLLILYFIPVLGFVFYLLVGTDMHKAKMFRTKEIEDKFILQFDGSGSMFPIYEEIRPGEPLWRTQCQYEDVLYSMFNESIKIFLNKAHPAYQYIDKTSKKYNQYLLLEVMSSALTTIILQIKDDDVAWSDIEQGKDSIAGSLAEAISYFRNKLEWKMNDAQALSLSIREFLGKRM